MVYHYFGCPCPAKPCVSDRRQKGYDRFLGLVLIAGYAYGFYLAGKTFGIM
jgi:hypothetical protein